MTYGAKTVIPLETSFPMLITSAFTSDGNDKLLKKSLDLIEERMQWSNWPTTSTSSSKVMIPM